MNNKGIKDKVHTCKNCKKEFAFRGYSYTHTFCSIKCDNEYRASEKENLNEARYQDWLAGKKLGVKYSRKLIRGFMIRRDGYKCSCCGISEWNGKSITLWADHIDGNASNDSPSNFRLVCPNCDSQSPTFGAKNYGKGRKSLGMSQYG